MVCMLEFKAIGLSNEFDLNKIARHFRINQKIQWEDLLIINEDCLSNILDSPPGRRVYVFSFGSAVFVNFIDQEILQLVSYINKIETNINIDKCFEFVDEYKLEVNKDTAVSFSHDSLSTQELEPFHGEIIATVLAKSVALEKNETYINHLLDDAKESLIYWSRETLMYQIKSWPRSPQVFSAIKLTTFHILRCWISLILLGLTNRPESFSTS
jgi:required for meiotic nuclear division protein 1